MQQNHLHEIRFSGDRDGAKALSENAEIAEILQSCADGKHARGSARRDLLANAVRVDRHILPDLDQVVGELKARAGIVEELECFVFDHPMINASVFQTKTHLFVLLSSAAVEKLEPKELEFVIGHELGHIAYGHLDVPIGPMLESDNRVQPKQAIQLLSWSRRAEISADRAGLLCCGSLDLAASAFFKVLSGLSIRNLKVNPRRFADQFDQLRAEIFREGAEEMWTMAHPLAPLRMKALNIFWESEKAKQLLPEAQGERAAASCDQEIAKLLVYMEPMSARSNSEVDPFLEPFLIWGGLYVAASNRVIDPSELKALAGMVGERRVKEALTAPKKMSHYLQQYEQALTTRERPLSALDINRIFTCLAVVVRADGRVDDEEINAMHELGRRSGVAAAYVDSLLQSL